MYAIHSLARDYYVKTWGESDQKDGESLYRALFHARRIERLKESHGEYIARAGDRRDKQVLNDLEKSILPQEEPAAPTDPEIVAPAPPAAEEPVAGAATPASTESRRDFLNFFRRAR